MCVVASDLAEDLRRVAAPGDPVTAALHGQVAVAVHHPGHDDRAAGVDDRGAALVDLVVRADRLHLSVTDHDGDAEAQRVRRPIGERGVVKDDARHVAFWPSPWY